VGFKIEVEKKRIEVVATNGTETRRLIWIEQGRDGSFYWGLCIPKFYFHSSYHASGKMLFSQYHKPTVWERISKFKGSRQLASIGIAKDFGRIKSSRYELKKLDGIVYVDFRTLRGDTINISLHLTEKGHTEFIKSFLDFLQSQTEISQNPMVSLFTFTNPWVAIVVYSS